jgi:uncharacterized protein YheU (UPF0270 family)
VSDHGAQSAPGGFEVPYDELSPDALQALIESFVLREGTDYGVREFSLEEKVAHVMQQLRRAEAHIVFDPETQSVSIVVAGRPSVMP